MAYRPPGFPPGMMPPPPMGMAPPGFVPPMPNPLMGGMRPPMVQPQGHFVPPTPAQDPDRSTRMWVGKIAKTVEDAYLRNMLEACGQVKSWKRVTDPLTGVAKGFGFVEFENEEGVLRALRVLNGYDCEGSALLLKVNESTNSYLERYKEKKIAEAKAGKGEENGEVTVEEQLKKEEVQLDEIAKKHILSLVDAHKSGGSILPDENNMTAEELKEYRAKLAAAHIGTKDDPLLESSSVKEAMRDKVTIHGERLEIEDETAETITSEIHKFRIRQEKEKARKAKEKLLEEEERQREEREREIRKLKNESEPQREPQLSWRERKELEREKAREHREKEREKAEEREFQDALNRWEARERDMSRRHNRDKEQEQSELESHRKRKIQDIEEDMDSDNDDRYRKKFDPARRKKDLESELKYEAIDAEKLERLLQAAAKRKADEEAARKKAEEDRKVREEAEKARLAAEAEKKAKEEEELRVRLKQGNTLLTKTKLQKKTLAASAIFDGDDDVEDLGPKKRKLIPLQFSEEEMKAMLPAGTELPKGEELTQKDFKSIIDQIPTKKEELFATPIDWDTFDVIKLAEKKVRPWVSKKIEEYLETQMGDLEDFIMEKIGKRPSAEKMVEEFVQVFDKDAEIFVVKLWRMILFEVMRVQMERSRGIFTS